MVRFKHCSRDPTVATVLWWHGFLRFNRVLASSSGWEKFRRRKFNNMKAGKRSSSTTPRPGGVTCQVNKPWCCPAPTSKRPVRRHGPAQSHWTRRDEETRARWLLGLAARACRCTLRPNRAGTRTSCLTIDSETVLTAIGMPRRFHGEQIQCLVVSLLFELQFRFPSP